MRRPFENGVEQPMDVRRSENVGVAESVVEYDLGCHVRRTKQVCCHLYANYIRRRWKEVGF